MQLIVSAHINNQSPDIQDTSVKSTNWSLKSELLVNQTSVGCDTAIVANIEANIVQNINEVSDGNGFQYTCLG